MNLSITVDVTSRIPYMTAQLEKRLDLAIRKTAFVVQREAQQRVPVDTGALKNSVYASTSRSGMRNSTYGTTTTTYHAARVAAVGKQLTARKKFAAGKRTRANEIGNMLPEQKVTERLSAIVAVGMEYGYEVEHGTKRKRAQPYMAPAVQMAQRPFRAAVAVAFKEASE